MTILHHTGDVKSSVFSPEKAFLCGWLRFGAEGDAGTAGGKPKPPVRRRKLQTSSAKFQRTSKLQPPISWFKGATGLDWVGLGPNCRQAIRRLGAEGGRARFALIFVFKICYQLRQTSIYFTLAGQRADPPSPGGPWRDKFAGDMLAGGGEPAVFWTE